MDHPYIYNHKIIVPMGCVDHKNKTELRDAGFRYVKMAEALVMVYNKKSIGTVEKIFKGWKAPAPPQGEHKVNRFKFKVSPWAHQRDALKASDQKESFALFMEQGTGKTKVVIDEASMMFKEGKITNVLILCPKSLLATWEKEIVCHCREYVINTWKKKDEVSNSEDGIVFSLINIDAINTRKGYDWAFYKTNLETLMIVDESTIIKNIKAKRTSYAVALGKQSGFRRILTGTPITKSPVDLYSQMLFLDPWFWGGKSFYSFRNYFAVMGGYMKKQIIGYQNIESLIEMVDNVSFRVTKEECLDLPAKVYGKRVIEMTPAQKRAYEKTKKELGAYEYNEKTNSVYNKTMVVLGKLHQIVGGNIKETGEAFDCNKIEETISIIQQGSGKTLIWCKYVQEIKRLKAVLEDNKIKTGTFYGGVHLKEREANVIAFNEEDMQVLILQYQSGGMGLTLNAASTVIFYSNDYSYANRIQAEDRCHRGGQTKSVTYIDLITNNTIDVKILNALRHKKSLSDLVLEELSKDAPVNSDEEDELLF